MDRERLEEIIQDVIVEGAKGVAQNSEAAIDNAISKAVERILALHNETKLVA